MAAIPTSASGFLPSVKSVFTSKMTPEITPGIISQGNPKPDKKPWAIDGPGQQENLRFKGMLEQRLQQLWQGTDQRLEGSREGADHFFGQRQAVDHHACREQHHVEDRVLEEVTG